MDAGEVATVVAAALGADRGGEVRDDARLLNLETITTFSRNGAAA